MFIAIKKRTLIYGFAIILAAAGLVICGAFKEAHDETKPVFAVPTANKIIVIDPGHGGFDAGASDNGLLEKDINLDVSLRVRDYIEQSGGTAVLTRSVDEATYDPNRTDGTSAKQSDLSRRKQIAESAQADAFVSIHMNKFPQSQYRGAQVFYSGTPEESKLLGETLQQALIDTLEDGNTRKAKKTDGSVLILKNTTIPSALVECGFLSNPQEAELLKTEEYRQKLAWAIYMGLTQFFNH